MYNLFGFNIYTKEERRKREKLYRERMFPGGKEEKKAVLDKLRTVLPKEEDEILLYMYIVLRERHLRDGKDYEELLRIQALPVKLSARERQELAKILQESPEPEGFRREEPAEPDLW